jgi:peptide/nickel transport system substrate-binding protein
MYSIRKRLLGVSVLLALLAIALTAAGTAAKTRSEPIVTWAESPQSTPNYIFPLESGPVFSTTNDTQFSMLMYLPLYWFGKDGEPVLNTALSMARTPVYSNHGTTVTITLKHWKWSNGQPITARDVIFWMNLLSAATSPAADNVGSTTAPGPGWGGAVAGEFPQNVVSYRQTGEYTLTLRLNSSYNSTWFTYNELSQVYPLPTKVWDKTSPTSPVGNYDLGAGPRTPIPDTSPVAYQPVSPGTASTGALGVAQYLNVQSLDLSTYTTSSLWKVVDGPFKLSQFTSSGFVKFVPNAAYSGPQKPHIAAFEELPFTSDTAEYDSLSSGGLTIGYIPPEDVSQKSEMAARGYKFSPWYDFAFSFMRYNFTNPTAGPIFRQLYFREAFQSLVNQPQYIKDFLAGYGSKTVGPVPSYPKNDPDLSPLVQKGPIYPYKPAHAVSLLQSHGWDVKPAHTTTCASPGTGPTDCGAGIKAGQPLTFALAYASGTSSVTQEMEALQSTAAQVAGITLNLSSIPFAQVQAVMHGHCTFATPCSDWTLANNGAGWVYGPDYLPTGEELFSVGAGPNLEYYDNSTNQANIAATDTAPTPAAETQALFRYENFIAKQLPVAWLPTAPFRLTVYKGNLKGLMPQGILSEIYPQDYSIKS